MPPANAQNVLAQIDIYGLEYLNQSEASLGGSTRLLRDLKALATITTKRKLEQLETLLRAGLEFVTIAPAPVPPPKPVPGDTTLPLLKQLEEHPEAELGIIAATARRMVAMFTVPRPTGHPQELPVGGISDITNRGTLDRLIPSELAYDDLTLTARLANNEALFFRRDTPPDEPATERIILLDSGLHLWGTPRVFTLAAALGLQSQAPASEAVTVFRRNGNRFQPLALDTVEAVKHFLYELPPDPNPASALRDFRLDETSPCRPDVFFVSVAQRAEPVLRALHDLALEIAAAGGHLYLLTVSRSGALELAVRSSSGTRSIATGRIDPDTLFASTAAETTPKQKGTQTLFNLPELIRNLAYYQQYPLPFRFPAQPYGKPLELGLSRLQMTADGRLMRWDGEQIGAIEICAGIPSARDYTITLEAGEIVVVGSATTTGGKVTAVVIDQDIGSRRDLVLASSHSFPGRAKVMNGAVILGYSGKVEACSLEDGSQLHSLEVPTKLHFSAVNFDGRKLEIRPIAEAAQAIPKSVSRPRIELPEVMGLPISCGYDRKGSFVVHTQNGRWQLDASRLAFCRTQTVILNGVQSFIPIAGDRNQSPTAPKFYQAEWNADCRLIYDTRGLLHFIFKDKSGAVELSLLILPEQPSAAWIRDWLHGYSGEPKWCNTRLLDKTDWQLRSQLFKRFAAAAAGLAPTMLPTMANRPQNSVSLSSDTK